MAELWKLTLWLLGILWEYIKVAAIWFSQIFGAFLEWFADNFIVLIEILQESLTQL